MPRSDLCLATSRGPENGFRIVRNGTRHYCSTSCRCQWVISCNYGPFSAVFSCFSDDFCQLLAKNWNFLIFKIWQILNNITIARGKILKREITMRVSVLNQGPLVGSNCDTVLKIVTSLRGQVDPEEEHSSQNWPKYWPYELFSSIPACSGAKPALS